MKNLNIKNAARGLLGTKRKCWLLALMLLAAALPAAGMPREVYAAETEAVSEAVQTEEPQTEEPETESKPAQTEEPQTESKAVQAGETEAVSEAVQAGETEKESELVEGEEQVVGENSDEINEGINVSATSEPLSHKQVIQGVLPNIKSKSNNMGKVLSGGYEVILMTYGSKTALGDPAKDLGPFQKNTSLSHNNKEVQEGEKVVVGEHYSYSTYFEEGGDAGDFSENMYFQLPDSVTCKPETEEQPFYDYSEEGWWEMEADGVTPKIGPDGNKIRKPAGWYTVDENGLVTFRFDPDYVEKKNNKKLKFDLDVTVTDVNEEGKVEFPWDGGESKTFEADTDTQVDLAKEESAYLPMDPYGPCIEYKVTLDVTHGLVKDPHMTDTMDKGLSYRENSAEIVVYDENGGKVTFPEGEGPELVETADGWRIDNLPDPLLEKQRVEVTYKCDVNFAEMNAVSSDGALVSEVGNTVLFTGKNPHENEVTKEAREDKDFYERFMHKSGSQESDNSLDWEIQAGPSGSVDVRGWTVTDELEGDQWIDETRPLELKWKDAKNSNSTIETYYIPWDEAIAKGWVTVEREDGKIVKFTFNIPKKDTTDKAATNKDGRSDQKQFWVDSDRGWENGDWVKIEYYTQCTPPADGKNANFKNTAHTTVFGKDFDDDKEIGIGVGNISKEVQDNKEKDCLTYTVTVDIPSWDELSKMLGNEADEAGHVHFYIRDQLEFGEVTYEDENGNEITDRYFVRNVPEDINIYADLGDDSVPVEFQQNNKEDPYFFYVYNNPDDISKPTREFEIWFGTDEKRSRSYWELTEPCQLVITYNIPLDAKLVREDSADTGDPKQCYPTDLKLRDLLNQYEEITNEVWAGGKKEPFTTKKDYARSRTPGDVDKKAEIKTLEDGRKVIEYQVVFNGFTISPEGEIVPMEINPNTFILEDTFDSMLEYVEGSLHVDVLNTDRKTLEYRFWYAGNLETTNNGETTTLRASAMNFTDRRSDSPQTWRESLEDYLYKGRENVYVFVYQLEVQDEYMKAETLHLNNTAVVHYGDNSGNDSAEVDFTPDVLQKDGKHEYSSTLGDYMEYTIDVNPKAADMVTGGEEYGINPGFYTLIDQMDSKLVLDITSIKVWVIDNETGESMKELNMVGDSSLVGPDKDNYVLQENIDNTFRLILPDQQHLKITYIAQINAGVGTNVTVTNTVNLEGSTVIGDQKDATFNMNSSSASAVGDAGLRLYKEDATKKIYIDGAEFQAYTIKEDGEGDLTVRIGEESYEFEKYGSVLKPEATKPASLGKKPDYTGDYYLLLETKAPTGYKADPKPVVFKFGETDEPETVHVVYFNEEDEKLYEGDVEVQYIHAGDNVVIFDNTPDTYELPETGGFGSMTYTLAGLLLILGGAFCLMYRRNRIQKGGW